MRSNLFILLSALTASMALAAPLPADDAVLDGGTHFYARNHEADKDVMRDGGDHLIAAAAGKRGVVVEEVGVHRVEERSDGGAGSGAGFVGVEG